MRYHNIALISLCRAQQCVSALLARLSLAEGFFSSFFPAGVVPLQALLSRRGTASDLSGLPGFLSLPLGSHKGPCREGGILRCAPSLVAPLRLRGHFVAAWPPLRKQGSLLPRRPIFSPHFSQNLVNIVEVGGPLTGGGPGGDGEGLSLVIYWPNR